MKHPQKTLIAAIAIAAVSASTIVGCGGSGGSSSATATGATTQQTSAAQRPEREGDGKPQRSSGAKAAGKPPSNSGAKAAAHRGSTAKSKTSLAQENAMIVRTYGVAGSSADRDQATQTAALFLSARAAGNWTQACSNLAAKLRAQIEPYAQTTTGSPEQRCADALRSLAAKTPKTTPAGAEVHALSLRVKDDEALLIYRDGAGKTFDIPMLRDGGEWKVGAVAPAPLA